MTWSEFRLSDAEQKDLGERFLQLDYYANQRTWMARIIPMLRQDSAGHVGIFRLLLQRLLDEFPNTEERPASEDDVCAFYFGRLFEQQVADRFFSFPDKFLSRFSSYQQALEQVLLSSVPTPPRITSPSPTASPLAVDVTAISSSPPLPGIQNTSASSKSGICASTYRKLMRIPLLVDDGGFLAFATPMHKRFFHRLAFPSRLEELPIGINIDQWLLLVFRTFQPQQMGNSNFKEGMFQHEFWRGASLCLPPSHRVAAEVSHVLKQGTPQIAGELDFWINSTLEWAIELLRQGDRKGEHLDRFGTGGAYGPLCPKQWRVVDFRLAEAGAKPPLPLQRPGYVSVVMCDAQCRAATVTFPEVKLPGGRTQPSRQFHVVFTGGHNTNWVPDGDTEFEQLRWL